VTNHEGSVKKKREYITPLRDSRSCPFEETGGKGTSEERKIPNKVLPGKKERDH